jgi:hypothetical protein
MDWKLFEELFELMVCCSCIVIIDAGYRMLDTGYVIPDKNKLNYIYYKNNFL